MLVLTRRVGEEIVIGENIHLMVVSVRGNKVRLGIGAPLDVRVVREEIREGRVAPLAAAASAGIGETDSWSGSLTQPES